LRNDRASLCRTKEGEGGHSDKEKCWKKGERQGTREAKVFETGNKPRVPCAREEGRTSKLTE